jgi:3',5'-cyclic AMP phosphodiesterase CpdA
MTGNPLFLLYAWGNIGIRAGILVAGLGVLGLFIPIHALKALPKNEHRITPCYAGFADIQATKNRFILVGDTQGTSHWEFWRERNDRERKLIVNEIIKREPAFVIHLGDLTTRGSSEKHWQQFDDMHKECREKKIPYVPILGNHDFYGNNKKAQQNYFERFPYLERRRWYSFTWKNVGFILVDSNFSNLTKGQVENQSKWYLSELERLDRDETVNFIIVCCHQAPFTNSRVVGPSEKVRAYFADPFLQFHKTRLFFSGHSHSYERFQRKDKYFLVSGGGGGPRHKVIIDPRKQRYQDLFSGPEIRFFHFCEIESRDGALVFRVLRLETDETFSVADPFGLAEVKR